MLSLRPILFCFLICACFAVTARAGASDYTLKFKDSATVSADASVLYNNLEVTNHSAEPITLYMEVSAPKDWKSLAGSESEVVILPGTTQLVPFNFLFAKNASAAWQEVTLQVSVKKTGAVSTYKYHLRNLERTSFRANSVNEEELLEDKPEVLPLGVYLKNTGNVTTAYDLRYDYQPLDLDKTVRIKLAPGKDTTYYYPLKVSKRHWKQMYQENIGLRVTDEKGNTAQLAYPFSRTRNVVTDNRSAYVGPLLTLDAGGFMNNANLTYFFGGRIAHSFGYHKFDFSYRSRMYSNNNFLNNMQQDIFMLNYRYKNFVMRAGTFTDQRYFLTFGNSLRLGYQNENKGESFLVTATRRNKRFVGVQNGDNLSATGTYRLGKFGIGHVVEANFDTARGVNGYVAGSDISFLEGSKWRVTANGALSSEQYTRDTAATEKLGYNFGYNATYRGDKIEVVSYVDHFSKDFVSFRRGSTSQMHFANWKFTDKLYAGPMYNRVVLQTNLFTDTVYRSDFMTYNITKYGLQGGWRGNVHDTRVTVGRMHQTGYFNVIGNGKFNYFDAISNINLGKGKRIMINSMNGFNKVNNENVWIGSQSLSFSARWFGFNGVYTRYSGMDEVSPTVETVSGGPYVSLSLFRNTTMLNANLNIGKASTDSFLRAGGGYGVTYNNRKTGTRANINGYLPFTKYLSKNVPFNEMRYMSFMVSQDIHLPIKQKYYDIKVVLYNDRNDNSILDDGEEMLENIPVEINDNTLVSNSDGQVKYKNLKTGDYKIGVYRGYAEEGLIASHGPEQNVHLFSKDETLIMPFKKGRVISGNVHIVQDMANTSQFSQQFIKIVATDSLDRKYTTLTDENGDFYLYVPEGVFEVSINASSFTKDIRASISNYSVNLAENDNAYVSFELKQKKRQIRFRDAAIASNTTTDQAPVKLDTPKAEVKQTEQPATAPEAPVNHAAKRHQ